MEFIEIFTEFLPVFMFATLALLLFSGYPVAFLLGGLSIAYGLIGYSLGVFSLIEFFNFVPRVWGGAAENLVLVALPTFVFMGVMMERSGVANDMLYCCQVLLRRVPGGLALAVTVMGTILAAMTGIIGASVTMMTALALPTMLLYEISIYSVRMIEKKRGDLDEDEEDEDDEDDEDDDLNDEEFDKDLTTP